MFREWRHCVWFYKTDIFPWGTKKWGCLRIKFSCFSIFSYGSLKSFFFSFFQIISQYLWKLNDPIENETATFALLLQLDAIKLMGHFVNLQFHRKGFIILSNQS